MRKAFRIGASVLIAASLVLAAQPANATDLNKNVKTWQQAANLIGEVQGTLFAPGYKAGLKQNGKVSVLLDNFTQGKNAKKPKSDMFVGATYGTPKKTTPYMRIAQKFNGTEWAAEPTFTTSTAPIGTVPVTVGPEGQQYTLNVKLSADCFPQPADANPTEIPVDFRCQQSDLATGTGYAQLTMRPYSIMNFSPNPTNVYIQTNLVSYDELVKVIQGLALGGLIPRQ